jgi:alpha-galactosidase
MSYAWALYGRPQFREKLAELCRRCSLATCLIFAVSAPALAADAIRFFSEKKLWVLDAGEATYALGVNERGELQSVYWGERVRAEDLPAVHSLPGRSSFDPSTSVTPQEYPGWGGAMYTEPALKVAFSNGNREVVLRYVDQELKGDQLEIRLKDEGSPLWVSLRYRKYGDTGVIERSARIENRGAEAVTVEDAQSAAWTMWPGEGARLSYLTGRWAGEWQLQREEMPVGVRVLESRRGSTSSEVNPWFAVSSREADEEQGRVWFGALGWSGSWRITAERSEGSQVRVMGGFSPFDFAYRLGAGEALETPAFYAGFTAGGTGEASRRMHRFELANLIPGGPQAPLRKILYNSWEATEYQVTEAGQMALAEKAARLGVERFVVDDGWFGQRNNDHAGLGDWYVNPQKFPHGLKPLTDRVHTLGMDFGLWVEPEMVNPDSDLYRKHPDWAMNFPGRPRTEARNQLVLNLARDDVKEYVFGWLDRLVTDNDIALLKWDYNRNWSEPGWPEVPLADQKKIWIRYVENLYDILDRLRAKHPKLEIEGCSGGSARVDLGMLRRVDQFWTSDNTDAVDRLTIQNGFTHAYPPHVMMAWVTDVPHWLNGRVTPLKFRFLVAMTGALGIGSDLNKMTADDGALATKMIALYKEIRPTVQNGKLYRLPSPVDSSFSASNYVSQDGRQVVLFAFLHSQQFGRPVPPVRLQGLTRDATYRVRSMDGPLKLVDQISGDYLMHHGVELSLRGDYDSTVLIFERVQ